MVLQGVQSFIHPAIVSLDLGGSWCVVSLPMSPSAQPQWRKPKPVRELFWRTQENMHVHQLWLVQGCVCRFCSCSVFQPFSSFHAEVQLYLLNTASPPVQGVQDTACCPLGSCWSLLYAQSRGKDKEAKLGQSFRSSESRSKAVSGAKFTGCLLAWSFCLFLESYCVSWLVAAIALSTSACFSPSHMPAPAASHGPGRDVTKIKTGKCLLSGRHFLLCAPHLITETPFAW